MVAGPVVSRLVEQFKDEHQQFNRPEYMWHHDQQESVQIFFLKYLQSMVRVIDGFGKPFEEESQTCLSLTHEGYCNTFITGSFCGVLKMGQLL